MCFFQDSVVAIRPTALGAVQQELLSGYTGAEIHIRDPGGLWWAVGRNENSCSSRRKVHTGCIWEEQTEIWWPGWGKRVPVSIIQTC